MAGSSRRRHAPERTLVSPREIGGLETNRTDQLVVRPTLQTTRDARIFAFGDCCSCTPNATGSTRR